MFRLQIRQLFNPKCCQIWRYLGHVFAINGKIGSLLHLVQCICNANNYSHVHEQYICTYTCTCTCRCTCTCLYMCMQYTVRTCTTQTLCTHSRTVVIKDLWGSHRHTDTHRHTYKQKTVTHPGTMVVKILCEQWQWQHYRLCILHAINCTCTVC